MRRCLLTLALLLWAVPIFAGPHFDASTLTLAWDAVPASDNVTGYTVVRGQVCDTWMQFVDVGNVTTYTFPSLPLNEPLCFAVQAYRIEADGSRTTSAWSNTVTSPPLVSVDPCLTASGSKGLFVNVKDYQKQVLITSPGWVVFQVLDYLGKPITNASVRLTDGTAIATIDPTLMANIRVWSGVWVRPAKVGSFSMFVRVTNSDGCVADSGRVPLTVK